LIGYEVDGDDVRITNEDSMAYAGLSWDWSFPDQVDRAEYETAKIAADKRELTTKSTHFQLFADIKNLSWEVDRQKQLMDIADEKIALAQSILDDETENYSYGKVSLNDYIDAVNVADNQRFNKIAHQALYRKLLVEWLRMTDRLVAKKDVQALR
jgi:outer membrane protein TolC